MAAIPVGRLGTPKDVGRLVAFLVSDDGSWINATDVVIDGGQLAPADAHPPAVIEAPPAAGRARAWRCQSSSATSSGRCRPSGPTAPTMVTCAAWTPSPPSVSGSIPQPLGVTPDQADSIALAAEPAGGRQPDPRAGADHQERGGFISHGSTAGVSVDYYIRLEQGREKHPSTQVLASIADALQLDHDAYQHLFRIAGFAPGLRTSARPERIDPDLRQLMDGWPNNPTLVLGRTYDVLARNRLGAALWRPFTYSDNLLLNVFLDDAAPTFYKNWRAAAVNTVAGFHAAAGAALDDPRVHQILEELTGKSPEFVQIWERNDARGKNADEKTFVHPDVGELTLRMQTFDVRAAPGQQLVVYHADAGTPSAEALHLLGTLAATYASTADEAGPPRPSVRRA